MENKIIDYDEIERKEAECYIDLTDDELQEIALELEKAFYTVLGTDFCPGPGTKKEVPDEIPVDDPDAPGARTVYSIGALDFDAETGDFL